MIVEMPTSESLSYIQLVGPLEVMDNILKDLDQLLFRNVGGDKWLEKYLTDVRLQLTHDLWEY